MKVDNLVMYKKVILCFILLFSNYAVAQDGGFTKQQIIKQILPNAPYQTKNNGVGRAPINIAICKYWGKRDQELNLPNTSSLSISLPYYTETTISQSATEQDIIILNNKEVALESDFGKRTVDFLNLFRFNPKIYFKIETKNALPTAAGLASSASGLAALVLALNDFYNWNLSNQQLSILARLGSGSASRSIYPNFVEWHVGTEADGMDSYAEPVKIDSWVSLRLGLIIVSDEDKEVSSRDGMSSAVKTSPYYKAWLDKTNQDITLVKKAMVDRNIQMLGETAESNALAMHSTAITSWPPLLYWSPESVSNMNKVWKLRKQHNQIYFTMDAGSNLVLIFEEKDAQIVKGNFPGIIIVKPLI